MVLKLERDYEQIVILGLAIGGRFTGNSDVSLSKCA